MSQKTVARWLVVAMLMSTVVPPMWPVAAETPTVDTSNTSNSSNINSQEIQNLPLNGRSFADLATLAPGLADNKAMPRDSVEWSQQPIPQELAQPLGQAIQEFNVATGASSGGVANAVTKSGTNEFRDSTLALNKNLTPRAGLVWNPFKDGRTKTYGDFGMNQKFIPLDLGLQSLASHREWPGEASGINGMVVATGRSRGKVKTAVVYDWDGFPLAFYTADDLNNHPQEVIDDLNANCSLITSGKVRVSGKLTLSGRLTSGKNSLNDEERPQTPKSTSGSSGSSLNYDLPKNYKLDYGWGGPSAGGGLFSSPISDTTGGGGAGQTTEKKKDKGVVTDDDVKKGLNKLTPEQRAALDRMGLTPQQPTTPPPTPPQGSGDKANGSPSSPSVVDDLTRGENSLPLHPNPTGEPKIIDNPDGSTTRTWPDGTKEITRPDGSQQVDYPDGHQFTRSPDGSTVDKSPDGSTVSRDIDGKETGRSPATNPTTPSTPQTTPQTPSTPQGGTQPTQPSTTTPKSSSKSKGTVTDEDIEKGLKKNKAAADAAKKYGLQKGGGAGATPSTPPQETTPPKSNTTPPTPQPDGGTKPTTPQGQTGASAPSGTVTDQNIVKGAQKLDKNKNIDQKSKDYMKSFLTPQGQQAVQGSQTTPQDQPKTGTTAPDASKTQSMVPKADDGWAVPPTPGVPFSGVPKLRDAAPPGSNPQAILHPNDFGADLGGPFVKDKLWFWGSGNRPISIPQGWMPQGTTPPKSNTTPTTPQSDGGTKSATPQGQTGTSTSPGSRTGFTPFIESGVRIGDTVYSNLGTYTVGHHPILDKPISMPQGWTPQMVGVLPFGCNSRAKAALLNDIRAVLDGKVPSNQNAYLWEPVFGRTVQDKKATAETSLTPNDPLYVKDGIVKSRTTGLSLATDQWGLPVVGFTPQSNPASAWNQVDANQPNMIVAVIDSGLDLSHPDGPQYLWTNPGEIAGNGVDDDHDGYVDDVHGWNFADENNDLTDDKGHGTLVAGIIAAKRNNGMGIAGINPGAQIMVLKVTNRFGQTNSLAIYRAIHYAADHGARVINISLGDAGVSKLEQLAVNYAHARGAVIVVAAGNQRGDIAQYGPPALRRVIAVGMLNMDRTVSALSNKGTNIGLVAPGEQIYSLHSKDAEWPGPSGVKERQYYAATGTSFAAPIVSAAASLILAKNPRLPNSVVEDILLDSATSGSDGWEPDSGWGLLNASTALTFDPTNLVTVRPTEIVVKRDKKSIQSVDLYGIVRGVFSAYHVELGEGLNPTMWQPLGEARTEPVEYGLLCHLDGEILRNSKAWTVRITAVGKNGTNRVARIPITAL